MKESSNALCLRYWDQGLTNRKLTRVLRSEKVKVMLKAEVFDTLTLRSSRKTDNDGTS